MYYTKEITQNRQLYINEFIKQLNNGNEFEILARIAVKNSTCAYLIGQISTWKVEFVFKEELTELINKRKIFIRDVVVSKTNKGDTLSGTNGFNIKSDVKYIDYKMLSDIVNNKIRTENPFSSDDIYKKYYRKWNMFREVAYAFYKEEITNDTYKRYSNALQLDSILFSDKEVANMCLTDFNKIRENLKSVRWYKFKNIKNHKIAVTKVIVNNGNKMVQMVALEPGNVINLTKEEMALTSGMIEYCGEFKNVKIGELNKHYSEFNYDYTAFLERLYIEALKVGYTKIKLLYSPLV